MAKFEIGEVVILQCEFRPECNGAELTILDIEPADEFTNPEDGVGYLTDFETKDIYWNEQALRKKPKPEKEKLGSLEAIESITKWNPNKEVVNG